MSGIRGKGGGAARPRVVYSRIGTDQSTMLKISYLELMNM